MEEKILIKGIPNQKTKGTIKFIFLMSFFFSAYWLFNSLIKNMNIVFLIMACPFAFLGLIFLITYLILRKCEIYITEKNVKGKTLFGKEVVLPLYMVSAYSTGKLFSTIAVATSSGITKFAFIGNYKEVAAVLSQKINERQENTTQQTTASAPAAQPSAMDDLKKLKELLDADIITQEEFDAKKKQLLGL